MKREINQPIMTSKSKLGHPNKDTLFGPKLKVHRLKNHWTQGEFAERLGLSAGCYNKLENGNSNPSLARVQHVANVLGVSVNSLFGDNKAELLQKEVNALKKELCQKTREIRRLQRKLISMYDKEIA